MKARCPYFCTPKTERSGKEVDLVAQLVEHNTFNVGALGSSPSGITESVQETGRFFLFFNITLHVAHQ